MILAQGRDIGGGGPWPRNYVTMFPALTAAPSTSGNFRLGTTNVAYTDLWIGQFYSQGPDVFLADWCATNGAQTMDYRVLIRQRGGGSFVTLVEVTGISNTTAAQLNTVAIPASCFIPDSGTDPLGREFDVVWQARRTAGALGTVDLLPVELPQNGNLS
ncbi:MAG: hypothetical protein KatS3mg010_1531 [Acidimicrobiia bacterium]|nr:MAG: hypothetical protein KatS3mg010_1531 [Acidimicrobiia bacterium]